MAAREVPPPASNAIRGPAAKPRRDVLPIGAPTGPRDLRGLDFFENMLPEGLAGLQRKALLGPADDGPWQLPSGDALDLDPQARRPARDGRRAMPPLGPYPPP